MVDLPAPMPPSMLIKMGRGVDMVVRDKDTFRGIRAAVDQVSGGGCLKMTFDRILPLQANTLNVSTKSRILFLGL